MSQSSSVQCLGPASVVFDPSLTEYDFGPEHPMSPLRVDLTMRLATELGIDVQKVKDALPEGPPHHGGRGPRP